MRRKIRPKYRLGLTGLIVVAAAMVFGGGSAVAGPVTGAVSTTDNPGFVDANNANGVDGACLNGPPHTDPQVNCNIYQDKTDVWLSGLPLTSSLGAGTYFFAVLDPGSQNPGPNDGSTGNLSSNNDAWTNREFTVDGFGNITSYAGTHNRSGSPDPTGTDRTGNMLQLFPYDNTSNPGGVYILAVCMVPQTPSDSPGVNPSDCKYDAFKVKNSQTVPGATSPTITKDAAGAFTTTYTWDINKSANKTLVEQIGGNAAFTYTIHVTHNAGTVGNVQVTGTITVFNPNTDTMTGVVTDLLSDGTVCSVTGGGTTANPASLVSGDNHLAYACDIAGTTVPSSIDNVATVTWDDQTITDGFLAAGSASFKFTSVPFTKAEVDGCTTVTDPVPSGGTSIDNPFPATVCVGDAGPPADGGAGTGTAAGFTFVYHTTYPVLAGCKNYTNTATESTDGKYSSVVVTVCGPLNTSALTIGFWKTTNGQALIGTYCAPTYKSSLASYLSSLGGSPSTGAFADAAGKTCSQLQTYVTSILKGATATNMNVMLRAQMLATALDVYFSDPATGYTATTKSGKKPPSTFLTHGALGGVSIDTTAICPMSDNSTTGTATCKNATPSTNGFLSGAFPAACMTVQGILTYESGNPPFNGSTASPVWYSGSRTLQEIAKNMYDQINNQDAFGCS